VLLGLRNPSGKLPVTFPYAGKSFLDHATPQQFPGAPAADGKQTVTYSEKLAIGYRWYDANLSGKCGVVRGANPCVAFPFGHGLSYTSFAYRAPTLSAAGIKAGDGVDATVAVTNTGKRDGDEVVQLYLAKPGSRANPVLAGFSRVHLKAGETKQVTLKLDARALSHVNAKGMRMVAPGSYTLHVGGGQPKFAKTVAATLKVSGSAELPK
jgi:beta-glucosidase